MLHRIFLSAAIVAGSLFTQTASADIARHCQASVEFLIKDQGPNRFIPIASITGRGTCANAIQADKCRERARAALNSCISAMWANRHNNLIPAACNSILEGSSRSGAKLNYQGIIPIPQSQRLTARASFRVCCQLRPNSNVVLGNFGGRINGDRKCAAHKIGNGSYQEEFGFPTYQMNCGALRAQGLCQAH